MRPAYYASSTSIQHYHEPDTYKHHGIYIEIDDADPLNYTLKLSHNRDDFAIIGRRLDTMFHRLKKMKPPINIRPVFQILRPGDAEQDRVADEPDESEMSDESNELRGADDGEW